MKSFADSFNAMLDAITGKLDKLRSGAPPRVALALGDARQRPRRPRSTQLAGSDFLHKLWTHDPSPWSTDPEHVEIIKHALGWVEIPQQTHAQSGELREFAQACAKRFDHVVVLGMGGSSLAPDILRATFGKTPGYPALHVLDSTDPQQIKALDDSARHRAIAVHRRLEVRHDDRARRVLPLLLPARAADGRREQRAPITSSRSPIPARSSRRKRKTPSFLRVFTNDPNIGGRYSALSYFGMVPAALAGYDVTAILDRAINAMHANARDRRRSRTRRACASARRIGALAKNGRDKLTIVTHPSVRAFGAWAEQLIAESTGKSGTGIVPIEGEPLGDPARVRRRPRLRRTSAPALPGRTTRPSNRALAALEGAGHPVIRLAMNDTLDIGEQFYLWEIATAAAGAVLGIDAFDQPNVQESKDNTKRLLAEFAAERRVLRARAARARRRRARVSARRLAQRGARQRSAERRRRDRRADQSRRLRRVQRVRADERRRRARRCSGSAPRCATRCTSRRRSASARASCTRPASSTRAGRTTACSSSSPTTRRSICRSPAWSASARCSARRRWATSSRSTNATAAACASTSPATPTAGLAALAAALEAAVTARA